MDVSISDIKIKVLLEKYLNLIKKRNLNLYYISV